MNDLHTLLADAAHPAAAPPPPDHIVEADLTRGRRALLRQRIRRGGAQALLAGVLAAGGVAIVDGARPGGTTSAPLAGAGVAAPTAGAERAPATSAAHGATVPAVQLVSYTGEQPAGFTVASVPEGWVLQGVDDAALVIARQGDPDVDLSSFDGKLVVLLQSRDEPTWTADSICAELPGCTAGEVPVGAVTGLVVRDDEGIRLFWSDAAGHRLVIQAPAALGWSDADIAAFGATVQATPDAVEGVG